MEVDRGNYLLIYLINFTIQSHQSVLQCFPMIQFALTPKQPFQLEVFPHVIECISRDIA
jgi:hypothetical protein